MAEYAEKPEPTPAVVTSSEPAILTPEQESLYREVLATLEDSRIPYAVSGAFALREYTGICRMTKDLDVFLAAKNAANALTALRTAGFTCDVADPVWLAKAHRDGYFVDLITGMSNGVIVVDDSWLERARPATIVGIKTRVLAPEELLASKLFVSRRERFDGADIAHIIYGLRGNLEWARVVELAGEHWEILLWSLLFFRYSYPAQTSFVPAWLWQTLLGRLSNALQHPDENAPFRGSLVDDFMFAIDVNEWGLRNLLREYRAKRTPKMEVPPGSCA